MGRARGHAAAAIDRFADAVGARRGVSADARVIDRHAVEAGVIDGALDDLVSARADTAATARLRPLRDAVHTELAEQQWQQAQEPLGAFTMAALAVCRGKVVSHDEHAAFGQKLREVIGEAVGEALDARIAEGELRAGTHRQAAAEATDAAVAGLFADEAARDEEGALQSALGAGGYDELRRTLKRDTLADVCPRQAWVDAFASRWGDARAGSRRRELLLSPFLDPAIRREAGWQPDTRRVVVMPTVGNESRAAHFTLPDGPDGDKMLAELQARGGRLES